MTRALLPIDQEGTDASSFNSMKAAFGNDFASARLSPSSILHRNGGKRFRSRKSWMLSCLARDLRNSQISSVGQVTHSVRFLNRRPRS